MRWRLALCGLLTCGGFALASQEPPSATTPPTTSTAAQAAPSLPAGSTESVQQALCRLIDNSARAQHLPVDFFTRLIWQESSLRIGVVSPAGAQGIAQFMPGTAAERGLLDPFDPEQAIPKSAELLRDHLNRFGNIGLAAAAYNGGPNRVANWLADRGGLPDETRAYVYRITARSAEEWAEEHRGGERSETGPPTQGEEKHPPSAGAATSCLQVVALLGRPGRDGSAPSIALAPLAPWGVQLAGNFSKSLALSSYARARRTYAELLGPVRPMVIGTRLRSRGTRTFYRVRVPASTRVVADQLCSRIRRVGGACIVLPS